MTGRWRWTTADFDELLFFLHLAIGHQLARPHAASRRS
jgi:hypothetical protein